MGLARRGEAKRDDHGCCEEKEVTSRSYLPSRCDPSSPSLAEGEEEGTTDTDRRHDSIIKELVSICLFWQQEKRIPLFGLEIWTEGRRS